ncbi:M15 family metallopeptidase [Actinoplanes sp. NPDC049265]|uniref:M15 family metallopeptidase n=1 Tax=Actinoplanes sp. NPDC049265 TaxID=3363902 RepID=UPI00371B8D19
MQRQAEPGTELVEGGVPGLPGLVGRALLMAIDSLGLTSTVLEALVDAGHRDPNALTNVAFWAAHPDLLGTKLRPSQRGFATLSREWTGLRNGVVAQALRRPPAPAPSASAPASAPGPAPAAAPAPAAPIPAVAGPGSAGPAPSAPVSAGPVSAGPVSAGPVSAGPASAPAAPSLKKVGKADTSAHALSEEQAKKVPAAADAPGLVAESRTIADRLKTTAKAISVGQAAGRDVTAELALKATDEKRQKEIQELLHLRLVSDEEATLTANGITGGATAWFAEVTSVSFLGQTIQVHRRLAERLAIAEKELAALPTPPGGWITSTSSLRDPGQSLHSFGLAIDLNPGTNPWLFDPKKSRGDNDQKIQDIIDRANLLVLGRTAAQEDFASRPAEADRDKRVEASYDKLQEASSALEKYFTLADPANAAALTALINAAATGRTAEQWTKAIAQDRKDLNALGGAKNWRDPTKGFLHLDKRLVKAMTNSAGAGLTWLGDDTIAAGRDIMHFDMRALGPIHRIVKSAANTTVGLGNG